MSRKLAVVSGGTRGIGRAIAEQFAKNDFDVVISARNETDLAETKQAIEAKYGVKCHIQKADLSIKTQAIAFAEFVKSLAQPIGMLTNNAGTFIPGNVHEEAPVPAVLPESLNQKVVSFISWALTLIKWVPSLG